MSEEKNQQSGETIKVTNVPKVTPLEPTVAATMKEKKRNPEAFKKMFDKVGNINIKPFIDGRKENMGLENYGMTVFPGIEHEEQLAAIERNGIVRYITGLDEFAPEVQSINDEELKESVIYNIRSIVAYLEKMLATNVLDIKDKDFWNKVKILRPDNHSFWKKVKIRAGNDPVTLTPGKDPYHLIKFVAIEAGGFDLVAKSYEDALAQPMAPKFYLDKEIQTVSVRASYKKIRNKAIGLLDTIANKHPKKLLYIAKVLDSNSMSYKNHTPVDILYDVLDDYINGMSVESNKTKAAEHFTSIANLDMETLKLKAIIKDASFYKVISLKADGSLYHTKSSSLMGKNVSDVLLYLKNPMNEDILIQIMSEIEKFWNS